MNDADFKTLALAAGIVEAKISDARAAFTDDGSMTVGDFAAKAKSEHADWFKATKAAPKTKFEYADPVLLVVKEAEKLGLVPDAVEKLQAQVSREVTEGKWVQAHGIPVRQEKPGDTFMTADEWLPTLEKTHPDYWPAARETKSADDAAKPSYEEELSAFGPRADKKFAERERNAFVLKHGEAVYREAMQRWNATATKQAVTALPKEEQTGTKAKPAAKSEEKPPRDHSKNPFHKSNWNVTAQSRLVAAIGLEKAASIARSVGVTIGDTRPNPNF